MTNYEYGRRNALVMIFELNLELWDEVSPYDSGSDARDTLLNEQYTLTVGGAEARNHIHGIVDGLYDTMNEFSDDKKICDLCEELINRYTGYESNYLYLTT